MKIRNSLFRIFNFAITYDKNTEIMIMKNNLSLQRSVADTFMSSHFINTFVYLLNCPAYSLLYSLFFLFFTLLYVQVISTRDSSSLYVPMILTNLSNATLWVSYGVLGVHDVSTSIRVS